MVSITYLSDFFYLKSIDVDMYIQGYVNDYEESNKSKKVGFNESDWRNNYTLSYLRAQFLNKFWVQNGIDLSAIPKVELMISGSGEGGVPRVVPDEEALRAAYPDLKEYLKHWIEEESKNQRFLVHIVPIIGNIDVAQEKLENLKGKR